MTAVGSKEFIEEVPAKTGFLACDDFVNFHPVSIGKRCIAKELERQVAE